MSTFQPQKIYIRQCHLDHTQSLIELSKLKELKTEFKISIKHDKHEGSQYEVILQVNIEIKHEASTVSSLELQQAGLFKIEGYAEEEMDLLLKAYCPNLVFPYLRQKAVLFLQEAGLNPIELPLIDFNAIYQQVEQQTQQKSDEVAKQAEELAVA